MSNEGLSENTNTEKTETDNLFPNEDHREKKNA